MKNIYSAKANNPVSERTMALLGDELNFNIPIRIFRVTKDLAKQYNYKLLYFAGEPFKSSFEHRIQSNILYNFISPQIADGLIIMSNLLNLYKSDQEFQKRCLQFHPLPMVSLGIAIEGIPSVILNNTTGMYDAVSHLIEVHHLTRIAFLKGPQEHPEAIERFAAFVQVMEKHGLPVEESLLLEGNFRKESGGAAVRELLDTRGKIPGRDVQAIVCCNDYMAAGVMLELDRRDILIPETIALVGFDDIPFTEYLTPSLASVHICFETMAARATELMIMLWEGKSVPEVVYVDTYFVPRRSCGCPEIPYDNKNLPLPEDMKRLLNTAPQKFLKYLSPKILIADDRTRMVWKQPLAYLRQKDKWENPEKASESAQNLDQILHSFLGGTVYNTFNNISYQNMIYDLGSALTSTMDISQLLHILKEILPGAGIGRCCICLYENPPNSPDLLPPFSRLILAFSQAYQWELPPGGLRFATAKLLPDEIVEKQGGWKSWVVIALYFGEEQLGYVLMDSDAPYENIYWNLRKQISGTLKGDRLLNETRKAYNLLMEVNEQKTQFFINVAHETKTPLTLIKNYLELYLEQHPPDEHLSVIKQNIDMLLDNMLNFLDVEKLQRGGTIYLHDTLVDLSASVQKKCNLFHSFAKQNNIRIIVNADDNILIRIDPLALDRILNNLLDNAVRYIQPGGRIILDVHSKEGHAVLRVSDNGPGLPVDTYEHIFDPYYLLSRKNTGKHGIGVGLSIVKKIVDGMGASIIVGKSSEGGACFTISFADSPAGQTGEALHEMPATAPSSPGSVKIKERNISAEKRSILIVDDNLQLLIFMQSFLEKIYNVFLARDVEEARFKLKTTSHLDLIIADIMMDGDDGFTLLSELTTMEGYNDIPFIFLTALSGEKAKTRALGLGAVDYIEKPFSIAQLLAKIKSIIDLRIRQKKQAIVQIKNKMEQVFSGMDQSIPDFVKQDFDSICKKYGIGGREPEVIQLLMSGLLHKEIATRMNLSLRGVQYHIAKIYKKCNVNNKYELFNKFQD